MKKPMKKYISYIFFTLAVIMTLSGAMGYFIMSSETDAGSSIRKVQEDLAKTDDARQERIDNATYDEDVDFARGSDIAEAKKNYHSSIEKYGIGSIYMPEANISVPILAGTSEWNLFNGVGTGRPDQELGEGLFVAMSHNLVNDRLLKKIDKMSSGDLVYASDFTDVYIYRVIDQKVVHETNEQYFKEPNEGDIGKMLLYRCEGKSGTDWRRALYSEFIEKKPISEVNAEILKGLDIDVEVVKELEEVIEEEIVEEAPITKEKEGNLLDRLVSKVVNFVGQYDPINNYFLSVYSIADSNPIIFGTIAIIMFVLYGIL